jgi:hypothetical protein
MAAISFYDWAKHHAESGRTPGGKPGFQTFHDRFSPVSSR